MAAVTELQHNPKSIEKYQAWIASPYIIVDEVASLNFSTE